MADLSRAQSLPGFTGFAGVAGVAGVAGDTATTAALWESKKKRLDSQPDTTCP